MIITIANSKGGVGKSTLAVHLAAWLHEHGHSVTLADCDTQQSSSRTGRFNRVVNIFGDKSPKTLKTLDCLWSA
ncbi:MAG: ParA family protein [Planctomycetales bacterium]|nr:ParA family protein [Planctomycetales bacterium]